MPETAAEPVEPELNAEKARRQNMRLAFVALAGFLAGAGAAVAAELAHGRWMFSGLALLNLWGVLLAVLHLVFWRLAAAPGAYRRTWQYVATALGGLVLAGAALWMMFQQQAATPEAGEHLLATALFLASGVIQRFLAAFVRRSQELLRDPAETPLLLLLRASSWLLLIGAAVSYLAPWQPAAVGWVFRAITLLVLALGIEAFLKNLLAFYQPGSVRAISHPAGLSSVLLAVFGAPAGGKSLAAQIEDLLGARLQDIWAIRFLARAAPWAVLLTVLGAWATTCFSVIPTGSQGVKVTFGKFAGDPLVPGLHFTAPWPFERVIPVETDRQRQILLGLERDLGGPILWTERHYEGEKNFLMAEGEELLTISVPIIYRIADPRAFLQSTIDPNVALENLAYRQLLLHLTGRDSFYVMTEARTELITSIREAIQGEIDALNLGLEITFLGFKDVHPPVEVTDAYQLVVSAREQRETMIDEARAYQAERLPLAEQDAERTRIEVAAAQEEALAAAQGAAHAFVLLSAAHGQAPGLFQFRRHMEALDDVMRGRRTVIVDDEIAEGTDLYLNLETP